MIEEIATVVANEQDGIWLSTTPAGTCHSCHASSDCGTGVIAKTFTPRKNRFFVHTSLKLLPGEQVRIGVAEQGLVLAAFMVYLLPLLLMLVALVLAAQLWQLAEGWLILIAIFAAIIGFALARLYNNKLQQQQDQVTILQVLSELKVSNPSS